MDVLTCIRKYSEEDIKMMIKKITEATDDEMGFYMDALDVFMIDFSSDFVSFPLTSCPFFDSKIVIIDRQ